VPGKKRLQMGRMGMMTWRKMHRSMTIHIQTNMCSVKGNDVHEGWLWQLSMLGLQRWTIFRLSYCYHMKTECQPRR
jgi:hypothetical protein